MRRSLSIFLLFGVGSAVTAQPSSTDAQFARWLECLSGCPEKAPEKAKAVPKRKSRSQLSKKSNTRTLGSEVSAAATFRHTPGTATLTYDQAPGLIISTTESAAVAVPTPSGLRPKRVPVASDVQISENSIVLASGTIEDRAVGSANIDEIKIEANSHIKLKGHVIFRAKRIVIEGILDGDFPIFLSNDSVRIDETILELHATEEIVVKGAVFLRHYFKRQGNLKVSTRHELKVAFPHDRLRISSPKLQVPGLITMSHEDLPAYNANAWIAVTDRDASLLSKETIEHAERVSFYLPQ